MLRGNPGKQAIKPEAQPSTPSDMPEPPEDFIGFARDEWWRLGPELLAIGLLTNADLMTFTAYCESCGRWQTARRILAQMRAGDPKFEGLFELRESTDAEGNKQPPRLVESAIVRTIRDSAMEMLKFAQQLGCTPVSRTRAAIGAGSNAPSKFGNLIRRN
jgi:P27 family predicted phage terminase small subunit